MLDGKPSGKVKSQERAATLVGIPRAEVSRALPAIGSSDRTVPCPECGLLLPESAQGQHLVAAHEYLPVDGTLLQRSVALTVLWDRVFATGDDKAHERLLMLLSSSAGKSSGRSTYADALEKEIPRVRKTSTKGQRRDVEKIAANVRRFEPARFQFWNLLLSTDLEVREFGRELLYPEVGEYLANEYLRVDDVRGWLDKLCPREDSAMKIRVGQRLAHFGAAQAPLRNCLQQLQGERPTPCPQCGKMVPQHLLEAHLRKIHKVYQFRGVQRSLADTLDFVVGAVCVPVQDEEAWGFLEATARDEFGDQTDSELAGRLTRGFSRLDQAERGEPLRSVADLIAMSDLAARSALHLARLKDPQGHELALVLAPRLALPFSEPLQQAYRRLLPRKRAPADLQISACVPLLRSAGTDERRAGRILDALVHRCSKTLALERLTRLSELAGDLDLIHERSQAIEVQIRLSCPRCKVEMRRPEMMRHLWLTHGLILDGKHVSQPWRLIKEWIKAYRRHGDPDLLVRCRLLGPRLDAEAGLQRVNRLVLAYGVKDNEARQLLLAQARQRRGSLCPHCLALVALPDDALPAPLNSSRGRISCGTHSVEVSERGLIRTVRIESPGGWAAQGYDRPLRLTRRGATLLLSGPLFVAALICGLLLPVLDFDSQWLVSICLGLAVLTYVAVQIGWRRQPAVLGRAVDHAWRTLVPKLHTGGYSREDSSFAAGLALTSIDHGTPALRAEQLGKLLRLTENAVAGGAGSLSQFAALKRLEVADAVELNRDPVPDVAAVVAKCFSGKRPLAFAQQLLAAWHGPWWTAGNLSRLRVLLCDRAFEAGLELPQLMAAGQLAPALGEILQLENQDGLAQLRLLWSLRAMKPWASWSNALSVFEMAGDPGPDRKFFAKYPDLLLVEKSSPPIIVSGRGVIFQDILYDRHPGKVEMRSRREHDRIDYCAVIDGERIDFRSDPKDAVTRLERWFRHFFTDFLPQVPTVYSWMPHERTRPLYFHEPVACNDCQRLMVARAGEIGVSFELPKTKRERPAKRKPRKRRKN